MVRLENQFPIIASINGNNKPETKQKHKICRHEEIWRNREPTKLEFYCHLGSILDQEETCMGLLFQPGALLTNTEEWALSD